MTAGSTKVSRLWDALHELDDDALTCAACEEILPAYLAAPPSRVDDPVWHAVARHLRSCPHCTALAAELQQLVQQATTATFPVRPTVPPPDLTFLAAKEPEQTPAAVRWWWIDAAGQLLITFSTELLATLTPPPLVGVKSAGAAEVLHHLTLTTPDLAVAINVQAAPTAAHCTLWVDVDIPSTGGWPHLAGIVVTLWRDAERMAQQTTDAYGKVVFPAVARTDLTALRLTVTPVAL